MRQMNVISTVLPKLSSCNIREFISTRVADTWPETPDKEKARAVAVSRPGGLGAKAVVKQLLNHADYPTHDDARRRS